MCAICSVGPDGASRAKQLVPCAVKGIHETFAAASRRLSIPGTGMARARKKVMAALRML